MKSDIEIAQAAEANELPIKEVAAKLGLTEADLQQYHADIEAEMQAAIAFAEASPWEEVADLERFVCADNSTTPPGGAA